MEWYRNFSPIPWEKEERALLRKQMEADYLGRTGKTLNDYYAQLDMEREAPPELTAGTKRLPVDAVSFTDEITECDGKLNFYIPINFDPDAVFGTNVASAFNDDWLNVYANFDWKTGRIDSALTVCLVCSDGHEFEFSYPLTSAEQVQLWNQMDAYCHQQNGQSLGKQGPPCCGSRRKKGWRFGCRKRRSVNFIDFPQLPKPLFIGSDEWISLRKCGIVLLHGQPTGA